MRKLAIILLLLAALPMLVLPTGAEARLGLPSIKNGLIELALSQVSSPGSFEITAGSIEDADDGTTSLLDVEIADDKGVWLTLERASFAWDSSAILGGELKITKLELFGLTVLRAPSSDAEAPELKPVEPSGRGLFDWPRSPIDLSVDGVRLEGVSIAEGILAQPIAFDAEGRAFDKGDLQEMALSVRRTDAVEGKIELSLKRDFAANTVTLKMTASEAAGGLVAASAGFPANAPARLTLDAEGPPEDWRLTFDAGVERVFDAQGQAQLAYADRLKVKADFSVTPGPELDPTLRTVLGDKATLQAEVVEGDDGLFQVVDGRLAAPALTLQASGAFATGAGDSDLKVALVALAPLADLADGVAFERFSFDGTVTGPQGALAAEGAMALTGLTTAAADAGALKLDGKVTQTEAGLTFGLDGSGTGLRIDQIGPEVIGTAKLNLAGALDGDLLTLQQVGLEGAGLGVGATGSYDLARSAGQIDVKLALPDMAPVAAAYGAAVQGALDANAQVTLAGDVIDVTTTSALTGFAMAPLAAQRVTLGGKVHVEGTAVDFDLDGEGSGLAVEGVPAELTQAPMTYAIKGRFAEQVLTLEQFRFDSVVASAEASGRADVAASELALDYRLTDTALAPVGRAYGVDVDGTLQAQGRAEGAFDALRLSGKAAIAAAQYGGQSYGDLTLTHEVTLAPALEGALDLTMRGGDLGDGSVKTRFLLDGAALTLEGLEARLLGLVASGKAAVNLDSSLVDGAITLAKSDLRPLGRFAGTELAGTASGKVTLAAKEGRQDLNADLALAGLASGSVRVNGAKLRLAARDLTGTPAIDAEASLSGVEADPIRETVLRATARGPLAALDFDLTGEGKLNSDPLALALALAGKAKAGGATTAVTLAKAELTVGADTVRLRQPLALRIAGGSVTAEGLDLALPGDGALTGQVAQHPGGFAGALSLARFPLEVLERWAGAPVRAGLLDLDATFDTRPGRAKAQVTARGRGIGFDQTLSGAAGLDIDLDTAWNGRQAETRVEARGGFGQPLKARLALPLVPGAGGVPRVPSGGALDGALAWTGDIGKLWALVPAVGHMLDGETDIDLRLGGTMAAPLVSGKVGLTDGGYQNLEAGTILTALNVTTEIAEGGTVRVRLDGSDGAKGKVTADATLTLGSSAPALKLSATANRAVLVRRDDVTAKISGDVALTGPLTALLLKGALKIDKAEVRLVNAIPPDVVDLDGIRIKGTPEPEGNGDGDSRIDLDLTVTAPRDIFVRGRGLDSEWKMDLAVKGDAADPRVTGAIEKVRGRLELLGRPFTLETGRITFDGGRKIDPQIDVALEREDNGIRGGIAVTGRASAPELHFTSTPDLPEDEVLPRLLFGQSKQSLTGAQALQLATGIATLMSGKEGPLDIARKAVGIDVLRVEGESVDDASVTVGRNIGQGIFVGAKQGLQGQGSAVTVEVDVFDGVKVDSEVKEEGGSNIGIIWRKDF